MVNDTKHDYNITVKVTVYTKYRAVMPGQWAVDAAREATYRVA